jgi:hypothetical protein
MQESVYLLSIGMCVYLFPLFLNPLPSLLSVGLTVITFPFLPQIYNKLVQANITQNIPSRDNNSGKVSSANLLHYSNEWTISASI